jgi:hemoglobin/transferrin/lactoferrin receptor protein
MMFALKGRSAQLDGSPSGHAATYGRGSRIARHGLLICGCCVAPLVFSVETRAQSTTLPPVTVEGKTAKAPKKAKPKSTPQAEPQEQPVVLAPDKARGEAVYRVPASTSTAGKNDLEIFGQLDTGDVLRAMAGTSTRENINSPGIAVNIRGFEGSGRVNMMLDGVRQNFRFVGHDARGFLYVDPSLLAGIDIARGTVITTGGAGSLVGTANFRTLDVDDIVKPGQSAGALTSATWGSNGVGWSEMAAAGVRSGSVGFAGAISKRDQGNFENGDGVRVPFTDQDLVSGLFKGYVQPTSDSKISVGGVFYDNDFTANSYLQNIAAQTLTLGYSYRPLYNPLIDFKLNAYRNEVEMTYVKGIAGIFSPSAGRVINDTGYGFDVSNKSRFQMGAVGVVLDYGAEHFADEVITKLGGANADGEASVTGLYSQATFSYGIFDVTAGLRYDRFTIDGSGTVPAGAPTGSPVPPGSAFVVDQDEGRVNPKITLAAKPLPWLQAYATYAESMRAPTTLETIAGGSHPGASTVASSFFPNPFLRPEIQKGFEFGTNLRLDGAFKTGDRLRIRAAYFDMDVEDYIVLFQPNLPSTNVSYFKNVDGTSRVNGVEIQSMYDAGSVFAELAYTYSNSTLPNGFASFGGHTFIPEHLATLTLGWRFMDERLVLGIRGTAASEGFAGGGTSPNTEGYALLDLFSSYKLTDSVQVGLSVMNVFDTAYSPYTTTPPTTADPLNPPTYETGRGRTFLLTTRAQF